MSRENSEPKKNLKRRRKSITYPILMAIALGKGKNIPVEVQQFDSLLR